MYSVFQTIYLSMVIFEISCFACDYYPERDNNISQETIENNVFHNSKEIIQVTNENNFGLNPNNSDEVSTIDVSGYRYHYDKNSEESDEYKSTLINYPYSVSIQRKGAHYATGALIDKRWILSAAGEIYNVRESIKLFKARLGSVDCKRDGILVPLKKVEIHPSYVYRKPSFDLALLRIAIPIVYTDFIRPIRLSKRKGKNAKFMTIYWPRIVVKGQVLPESAKERVKYNSMRVSTQKLIFPAKCSAMMYLVNEVLDNSSLCLKPVVTHHSTCMPDVGAPVLAEDGLWGITSGWISPKCPTHPGPTLFTRLSSLKVRAWLHTHLYNF